ncbi:MAG: hypothetical protein OEV61_06670 [Chloroflexota bacterium]|jgi:hypothetical protein|nr:hypothetical protein [Chloroflexota bacterium]MDH5243253.1 hypothetical protein [Chloroflexota bacterium]
MHRLRIVIVVAIGAMVCAACSSIPAPSESAVALTPAAPTSTTAVGHASASTATHEPTPTPMPEIGFRALDTPAGYSRSQAEAVDGTTAVGWVQVGIADEQPAVWDTTSGALRVLSVPKEFVHPNGDTFVRLEGVSGTTAVGTGILGAKGKRGQTRAMAWDLATGDLRILDIPAPFTQTEAHAIDGTTAIGQSWTAHGETGAPVTWDTESGAVRSLEVPAGIVCIDPHAVSGDTIVGTRCDDDDAMPVVWSPITAEARDLDMLPATRGGIPRAVDGVTAVGECCFGEEGTPLPMAWDTATGAVRQLSLPAPFAHGSAVGVSGSIAVGRADTTQLVWDLGTDDVRVLPAPPGYDEYSEALAVSGRTIAGYACQPPASISESWRCVAAAWTLP